MHRPIRRPTRPSLGLATLVGLLLAGCAGSPTRPAASDQAPALIVEYPTELRGFRSVESHARPDPKYGTHIRYVSTDYPAARIDMFAYPIGFTPDPEDVLGSFPDVMDGELKYTVENGAYDGFAPMDSGRLLAEFPWGERAGAWQAYRIDVRPVPVSSLAYLFYRAPFGIKLRVSQPLPVDEDALLQTMHAFARDLVPRIAVLRNQGCDNTPPVTAKLDEGVDENSGAMALADAVSAHLVQLGMEGCFDYDKAVWMGKGIRRELGDDADDHDSGDIP